MSNSRLLTLAFTHVSEGEPCMNRLTACVSKNNVFHVELGFEDNEFFSILYGSPAMLRFKRLENENYEIISIHVSKQQYDECYEICCKLSPPKKKIMFDNIGMWSVCVLKCLPWFINDNIDIYDIEKTFCSSIITKILQQVGVEEVKGLSPSTTTPSDLFEAFKKSYRNVIPGVRFMNPKFKLEIPNKL